MNKANIMGQRFSSKAVAYDIAMQCLLKSDEINPNDRLTNIRYWGAKYYFNMQDVFS